MDLAAAALQVRFMSRPQLPTLLAVTATVFITSCTGLISDPGVAVDGAPPFADPDNPSRKTLVWLSGARRLTAAEYRRSVEGILGMPMTDELAARIPADAESTYGNDFQEQSSSEDMIRAYEAIAEELAEAALGEDRSLDERTLLLGCRPSGPRDASCLRRFIEDLGLRAFRRPLLSEEVDRYATLLSYADNAEAGTDGFFVAARLVLRVFLQNPRFMYRVEGASIIAEGTDDVYRLDDWEIATRLAFALTGTTPDDELLAAATAGDLATTDGLRGQAERLLDSPGGHEQVQRFHARWLGFERMPAEVGEEGLSNALVAETRAVIERLIFAERRPWADLFRAEGTFLNDQLAEHYGLPAPGTDELSWTPYGESGRAGILSHGTFLSNGRRANDTSVVARGLFVRRRLLCQDIPPPPPNVDADTMPARTAESPCKIDVSAARQDGMNVCANCHRQIDPIGFGLEQYDGLGRFRTTEPEHPECVINGEGAAPPLGEFNGPGDLGHLLAESEELDGCLVKQLYTFVAGHEPDPEEEEGLVGLVEGFREDGGYLDELLLDLVTAESFRYRRLEAE